MTFERTTDPIGHVLDDRYEVVKKLARGGMATVYVAHDLRLSRTVAIKVMNEGLGDADEFTGRFDAEARAAARLTHPNVVSVFDQGSDDGRPYIVMEYVPGFTLRQVITREAPMDPRRAVELIEPVCAALAAAHAAGLIHRDVKPENVLISERGQVKVADFGLARAVTAQSHAGTAGLVIGTVSYIAPELVTKGRADPRSDVYSLGIVLYEMLTGRKPHRGDTPIQVAYSHVHHQIQPPSSEVSTTWRDGRGAIPGYLDALVTAAASRDRPLRPRDAGILLGHLRAVKDALARGVVDDPALLARVRRTEPDEASAATAPVPTLPPRMGAERQFTPVTPVSPTFDVTADGAPFYSNGPTPYSPESPHTRALPVLDAGAAAPAAPGKRPPSAWRRIVAAVAVLAVLGGAGWGGWWLLDGRWTITPTLASLTQAQAEEQVADQEFALVFQQEYSEDVPVGQIIRTQPEGDQRVLLGGTVTAWLSRGPERYAVPAVTGRPLEEATQAIGANSLTVGDITQDYHDTVAEGRVVSQGVESGTQVKRDTPVSLIVSRGPAPVTVVGFVGQKASDLEAWASQNAIELSVTSENHDTVPSGVVLSQDPVAGELHRGGSMSVRVSKGPVLVIVPTGLRGQGQQVAAQRVRDAGLVPEFKRVVPNGLGWVIGSEPGEGASVPKGSTVILNIV